MPPDTVQKLPSGEAGSPKGEPDGQRGSVKCCRNSRRIRRNVIPYVIPTAAKRSGEIFPSSKNNQRKVKSATWEDSSTHIRSLGMTCRGVVPFCPHGVIFGTLLGDESSPLHCVVPYIHTGCIRNVAAANSRPYMRNTSAPVVPTMWNVVPRLIPPLRFVPTFGIINTLLTFVRRNHHE